jgi:putative inorganic carbon (HCO3(-)) transporter
MNSSQLSSGMAGAPFQQGAAEGTYGRLRQRTGNSLVLAILSPFLVLRTEFVQKILLAIVILDIPLQFGTHLFYREDQEGNGTLVGLSISATTIALAGLYISWLMRAWADRTQKTHSPISVNVPLMLYIGLTMLSACVAEDVSLSFFEIFLLLQMYLVYLYVASTVQTRRDVLFVVGLLIAGCLLESAIMVALRFSNLSSGVWGPTHLRIDSSGKEAWVRVGGTVGSPGDAAAYLSIVLGIAVGLLFTNVARVYKWLAIVTVSLGGIALIFTFSRGGWIAATLAVVLLCFVAWRRRGVSLRVPIFILVLLALVYAPFYQAISDRMVGDDNGSAESRIPLNNLAFRMVEANPVLGVGSNNFSVVMDRYLTSEFRHAFLYAVHNRYLLIWAEIGAAGLLAYLAFLLGALRKGWKCWLLGDPFLSPIALGIATAIVGHMVQMSVDIFRGRPTLQLLSLVAGLLAAIYRMSRIPGSADNLSSIT